MPHTEPQETDAAEAFDGVRRELSLLRSAIEGLTAARENIPDYSETLGGMDQALKTMATRLRRIEESPAFSLSPTAWAQEMNEAAKAARAEDRKALRDAQDGLSRSLGHLDSIIRRTCTADEQSRRLLRVAIGGCLTGILLWSILPGTVLRSLPANWRAPEWMAARMMGEPAPWAAGVRMMQADKPRSWAAVIDAVMLSHDNRQTLGDCKKAARKSERLVQCAIVIPGRSSTSRSR